MLEILFSILTFCPLPVFNDILLIDLFSVSIVSLYVFSNFSYKLVNLVIESQI